MRNFLFGFEDDRDDEDDDDDDEEDEEDDDDDGELDRDGLLGDKLVICC